MATPPFDEVRVAQTAPPVPSTHLVVSVRTAVDREQRRHIRTHVSLATKKPKGRRRKGRKPGSDESEERNALYKLKVVLYFSKAKSPLHVAGAMCDDPFDSLPVKAFPGMHDLISFHFDVYNDGLTLTDDAFVGKKGVTVKPSNTIWSVMSAEETSLLVFLAEMARLRDAAASPSPSSSSHWRTRHLTLRARALKSVSERLPSSTSEPQSISDAYVVAVAAMQCAAALFGDTPRAALSHLSGMRELVRLRGGISAFQPTAVRMLQWCEYFACAAHGLLPTILPTAPPAPPPPSAAVVASPFPRAFLPALTAAHSRTLARLPARWLRCRDDMRSGLLSLTRIVYALHLVSAAKSSSSSSWLMEPGEGRDAVARVLGGAEYALLVELARVDGGGNGGFGDEGGKEDDEEEGDEEEDEGDGRDDGWLRGVLLHAAQTYLWTCLGDLPPGSPMNVVFLERLRRALGLDEEREAGEAVAARGIGGGPDVGGCGWTGGGGVRAALARCGGDAEGGLVWALAVGWSSAFTIRTAAMARGSVEGDGLQADHGVMAARGEAMLAWFEDRIVDTLGALGEDGLRRAVCVVDVFPGTDGFRRGWQALLRQERFQRAARR